MIPVYFQWGFFIMHLKRLAVIAFTGACALAGANPGLAQGIGTMDRPSEMPPSDFSGRQFVDSQGCVFVRAGLDGAVIWVPRVTRERNPICGYAPTFGADRAAADADGAPMETVASRPGTVDTATKPPLAPPPATVVRREALPGGGKDDASWDDSRLDTRAPFAQVAPAGVAPSAVTRRTRIVPDQVWQGRTHVAPVVPSGYRPAWKDDRLNPHRAWQTVGGFYDTQRRWTNTVPRENPAPANSRYVPAKDPVLLSPAQVDRDPLPPAQGIGASPAISTRSGAEAPKGSGERYVGIGLFTTRKRAQEAANRLGAAGLPVRFLQGRSDPTRTHVVVGPYADQQALDAALMRARAAGYVQAYLR